MAKRKYSIKTIKETDPSEFDQKVNQLLEDGYRLDKSRVVTTEDDVYFVAFTRKIEEESFEPPVGSKAPTT